MVAGRYALERPLGHGAMAVVDLARDVELDRPVALKRLAENLARDDELRARFLREARLAARLAHPNVVHVYDVGEDDGRPFMAMEYVDGETLAEHVARRGPLPPDEAAELGIQICRGLAAVHAAGLVHRDVKPQNLLLRRDGVLKLGDFGIAFGVEGTRLTMAGTVLGTAAYLAPEQARGDEVTASADVYGVGAVLYELLTGRPPRAPSSLAELAAATTIQPPAGAPPALAAVVMRCLDPEPNRRPASAADVARELAATLPEAPTLPLPEPPSQRATEIMSRSRGRRRVRPAVALTAVAVGAIGGGVGAAIATSGGGGSTPAPATVTRVSQIPHAATAEQQAQNLAAWLTRYSR
jgi:eukaryotic-like serine/threonine-protein kinase